MGSGMLVDENGQSATSIVVNSNIEDWYSEDPKFVIVKGCQFDPIGKSEEQLGDFS